jgi:hypothetical protein
VAVQQAGSRSEVTDEEIQHARVFLEHVDIPTLEDLGLIRFDGTEGVVRLQEQANGIGVESRLASRHRRRAGLYYGLIGFGLTGIVSVDLLPLVQLPEGLLSGSIVLAVIALVVLKIRQYSERANIQS